MLNLPLARVICTICRHSIDTSVRGGHWGYLPSEGITSARHTACLRRRAEERHRERGCDEVCEALGCFFA